MIESHFFFLTTIHNPFIKENFYTIHVVTCVIEILLASWYYISKLRMILFREEDNNVKTDWKIQHLPRCTERSSSNDVSHFECIDSSIRVIPNFPK